MEEEKYYVITSSDLHFLEQLAAKLNSTKPFNENLFHPWSQYEVQKSLSEVIIREAKEREIIPY